MIMAGSLPKLIVVFMLMGVRCGNALAYEFAIGKPTGVLGNGVEVCQTTDFSVASTFKVEWSLPSLSEVIALNICDHYSDNPYALLGEDESVWEQSKYFLALEKLDQGYSVVYLERLLYSSNGDGYLCLLENFPNDLKNFLDIDYVKVEGVHELVGGRYDRWYYTASPCWEITGNIAIARGVPVDEVIERLEVQVKGSN
jgi:hypothetical protein